MSEIQVEVQIDLPANYCFIHGEKQLHFNLEQFKLYSNFFILNPRIIQLYPNGYPIEYNENDSDLFDESIADLINFCKGKTITINHKNALHLKILSDKFNISYLIKVIDDYISKHPEDFIFDFLTKNENSSTDTTPYEDIISNNLVEYVKDDKLLTISIPMFSRILTKYQLKNNMQTDSNVIDFLFKYLDKYGKKASVLFEKISFASENSRYLQKLLSPKYCDEFDFHIINTEYHKTIYDLQNEIIQKDIQIMNKQSEIMDLIKKHKDEINEIKKEKEMQIDQQANKFAHQLNEIKEHFSKEIAQKTEKISELERQIEEIKKISIKVLELERQIEETKKMLIKVRYLGGGDHNGIIAKLGSSVSLSAGGDHRQNDTVENLRKYDDTYFANYYNSKTGCYDGNLGKKDNSWIEFDFGDKRVDLFSYYIRSNFYGPEYYHPKSWSIKGSNDNKIWVLLDSRINDNNLQGVYKEHHFECQENKQGNINNRYRYIKFIQEDSWDNNKYNIFITFFELYGDIY